MKHHIAQMNWGRLLADWNDPRVAEFVDALDAVNALAERSPGFVWRLSDAEMEHEQLSPEGAWGGDDRIASTLSVWRDAFSLRHFVRDTLHGRFMARARLWFAPHGPDTGPAHVLWRVPEGHRPGMAEARARLADLAAYGPTTRAFDLDWPG
jgi:hypothetical protein